MTLRLSIPEFQRWLTTIDAKWERAIVKGLRKGALRLERYTVQEIDRASPRPAVDTGELRKSVDSTFVPDGAIVSVDAPHAPFLEYGTRPFSPPIAPLMEWAKRKGFASTDEEARAIAFRVQKAFSRRGMQPRGYFAKAWARLLSDIESDIMSELNKVR